MERINGKNIYEYSNLPTDGKRVILQKLVSALKELHSLERLPADSFSIKEAYFNKTMSRLQRIRDLIPLADQKTININGRECRNIYYHKRELEQKLDSIRCDSFVFIHGDCTFSNLMLKNDTEPVFIDPRGYFGHTELYGDPNYDWAKLYYSVAGNYDRFNLKDFRLTIDNKYIDLKIASNLWEGLEQEFFDLSGTDERTIKLLHAIIWLSLTTYAWQDYDSICGAFYNGLYYLEEVL
jgi:thiamine kinase-like enzyme